MQKGSKIITSYANVAESGLNNVGGLVGFNEGSTIQASYSIGRVQGNESAGGLVGKDG